MSELLLTQLPVTYFDSMNCKTNGSNFEIKMSNAEHQIVILLSDVLALNVCKNSLTSDDEDWIDVIEIVHEYRIVTDRDLRNYSGSIEIENLPPLHIISIYGNIIVDVICEKVQLN